MSTSAVTITPALYQYLVEHSVRPNAFLEALYKKTAALPAGKMASSQEQLQFMAMLVKLMSARRIIEIGTFTGCGTLALALALPEQGRIVTCDVQASSASIGEEYWVKAGVRDKITSVVMPALSFLDELILQGELASFDMAYIDADKKNYHHYYEKLLMLVRPGGLIVIDNVLWSGEVINHNNHDPNTLAIRQFNNLLKNDARVDVSILPIGDGLTLARILDPA